MADNVFSCYTSYNEFQGQTPFGDTNELSQIILCTIIPLFKICRAFVSSLSVSNCTVEAMILNYRRLANQPLLQFEAKYVETDSLIQVSLLQKNVIDNQNSCTNFYIIFIKICTK